VAYSGWHCTRLISPAGSSLLLLHHNNNILRILRHLVLLLLPPLLVLLDINLRLQREEKTYLEKSICLHVRLVRLLGVRKQGIMVIGELLVLLTIKQLTMVDSSPHVRTRHMRLSSFYQSQVSNMEERLRVAKSIMARGPMWTSGEVGQHLRFERIH
jgi:hypothetical protein